MQRTGEFKGPRDTHCCSKAQSSCHLLSLIKLLTNDVLLDAQTYSIRMLFAKSSHLPVLDQGGLRPHSRQLVNPNSALAGRS